LYIKRKLFWWPKLPRRFR